MIQTIRCLLLTMIISLFFSCGLNKVQKSPADPKIESTELQLLERQTLVDNQDEYYKTLGVENLAGQIIKLKLCVMPNGRVAYAELLEESTFEISMDKKKELLKAVYQNTVFDKSNKKEDCGLYKIE